MTGRVVLVTSSPQPLNRLSVDIGGTFTDIVVETATQLTTLKVLTTSHAPEQAVLEGALETLAKAGVSPADIDVFVHGTTLATNAIIERKGARTGLIATEGFRDVLDIADESRYNQYDIFIDRLTPLTERHLRFTVPERIDPRGSVIKPLDEDLTRAVAARIREAGIDSVAVALLHAYANPEHECRIRDILLREAPTLCVSLSSEVSPEIREYERTSTVVANAYVQPLIAGYLARLKTQLQRHGFRCAIYLMTSSGGLTTLTAAMRFPVRLVESGPAGGAILANRLAQENAISKALSFDMGGTTAKICIIDDYRPQSSRTFEIDRRDRFMKGSGFPLRIPVIEMVEIGAGGGSIARVDRLQRIAVGPESAGSEPGPACYARGGTSPTVTDADVLLGRIDPTRFAAGRIALDAHQARAALHHEIGSPLHIGDELAALGVSEIVDENMANAARVHSVERGKVISDYTIIAFGGAAPLHVVRLAEKLGIAKILIPPNASVGSALGFLRAPVAFEVVRSQYMRLDSLDIDRGNRLMAEMRAEAIAVVLPGAPGVELVETRSAFMRYVGQGHEIAVPLPDGPLQEGVSAALRAIFEREYTALFARSIPQADIEILTWTLNLAARDTSLVTKSSPGKSYPAQSMSTRPVFNPVTGVYEEIAVYQRNELLPGASLSGPAIIAEEATTTVVTDRFDATINSNLCIVLSRR
jgi:N-methylhydantoinase A